MGGAEQRGTPNDACRRWVGDHRGGLRVAGAVVARAVVVVAQHRAASTVLWVAVVLAAYLVVLELMTGAADASLPRDRHTLGGWRGTLRAQLGR